ncbi:MAG: hypothetical protein VCB07_04695 [Gammaproteobacteria bacterium]
MAQFVLDKLAPRLTPRMCVLRLKLPFPDLDVESFYLKLINGRARVADERDDATANQDQSNKGRMHTCKT